MATPKKSNTEIANEIKDLLDNKFLPANTVAEAKRLKEEIDILLGRIIRNKMDQVIEQYNPPSAE